MARLIDANLLVKQFLTRYTEREKQGNYTFVACEIKSDFRDMMDEMPTVDAVPVVHGYWKDSIECSECEQIDWTNPNYCPNCGAKMDLERSKDV